jgi:glycosyltransferase 2 family protein
MLQSPPMQNLRSKIILSLVLALVVILALAFYSDLPRLLAALAQFKWQFFPLALVAAFLNYVLRFVRWHYYLGLIGAHAVPRRQSFLIFFAGMSLTMTPGKMGEVVKSFLLKERYATPLSVSAPVVAVERLTDVLGVFALASLGLVFYPVGLGAVALFLVAVTAFIVVILQRALSERLLDLAARLPFMGRIAHLTRNMYESAYLLLRAEPLVIAILLAIAAWFAECFAFYLVLLGAGQSPTLTLLLQATFIYAATSLLGAISMLPGGLGATEGSMALLLEQIVNLAREEAVAATLIIRLCTLWFAVGLGLIGLLATGLPRLAPEPRGE